jgi:N-acetylneuraminate lyase
MSFDGSGLVCAVHTPFHEDGRLNLAAVEVQAQAVPTTRVFIGGTTGECHSLTVQERLQLAERWARVAPSFGIDVIVHVGSNCLADAKTLAAQAQRLGVSAISAHAPSYFKPNSVPMLVACCQDIASSAPETPFYFYDIPSMTGVTLPMLDFLTQSMDAIPTFAGMKYTNTDLTTFLECQRLAEDRLALFWGIDEMLLAAWACGARQAVGSTYNFAMPIYQRLLDAFAHGDLSTARTHQLKSVELVRILGKRGYMASAKALMGMIGVDVGPPRLPHRSLTPTEKNELHGELSKGGFLGASPKVRR